MSTLEIKHHKQSHNVSKTKKNTAKYICDSRDKGLTSLTLEEVFTNQKENDEKPK
jgi:hypothetical protein